MNDDDPILNQPLDLPGGEDPLPHKGVQNKKKNPKKFLIGLFAFLLVIGLATGIVMLLINRDKPVPNNSNDTPAAGISAQQSAQINDVPEATNTESYTSSPYRITFSYPKTWTVTEANDNGIRVESKKFSYTKSDGSATTGNFRIYIRKGARDEDGSIIGKGVAITSSEKLKYDKPTPSQRKETNLSQFGINTPDNFAFFLIAGNYELKKGDTLGPDYGKEAETIIIAGGYSGDDHKDDLATNTVPTDWFKTTNAYKQAMAILQSLEIT